MRAGRDIVEGVRIAGTVFLDTEAAVCAALNGWDARRLKEDEDAPDWATAKIVFIDVVKEVPDLWISWQGWHEPAQNGWIHEARVLKFGLYGLIGIGCLFMLPVPSACLRK